MLLLMPMLLRMQKALKVRFVDRRFPGRHMVKFALPHPTVELVDQAEKMAEGINDE